MPTLTSVIHRYLPSKATAYERRRVSGPSQCKPSSRSEVDGQGLRTSRADNSRVCSPPAPEPRAPCVHTDVSPVLAQTFTEPFVVFSAKRFPGVPGKSRSPTHAFTPCIAPDLWLMILGTTSRYHCAIHCLGEPRTETAAGTCLPSPQSSLYQAEQSNGPQRNRNGSNKAGRKRRRDGSDGSGDESD